MSFLCMTDHLAGKEA